MKNKSKCLCCGFLAVESISAICPICFWQHDFFQEENIDDNAGPNQVSLREAKENYLVFGACEARFINLVRPSEKDEIPE